MGSDPEELFCLLGSVVEQAWKDLAKIHWPGALTLVLPARGTVLEQLHPGGTSLGLRVPQCRQALELLERSGPWPPPAPIAPERPLALRPLLQPGRFRGCRCWHPCPGRKRLVWQARCWPGAIPVPGSFCALVL